MYGAFLKIKKNNWTIMPCNPEIPLLDIYPKELKSGSGIVTCTLIVIEALFTIVKIYK